MTNHVVCTSWFQVYFNSMKPNKAVVFLIVALLITMTATGILMYSNKQIMKQQNNLLERPVERPSRKVPKAKFDKAIKLLKDDKNYKDALAILKELQAAYPNDVTIVYYTGMCYYQLQNYKEAEKLLLSIKEGIRSEFACFLLGNIKQFQKKFIEAAFYYRKALEKNPNATVAHIELAITYAELKLYDKSMIHIKKSHEQIGENLYTFLRDPRLEELRKTEDFIEFMKENNIPEIK